MGRISSRPRGQPRPGQSLEPHQITFGFPNSTAFCEPLIHNGRALLTNTGIWKEATTFPLKQAGKPLGATSSYRSVSLTSCGVKTMERIVHNRLYNIAERRGWLSSEQAGFRKLRSCEDQILRITPTISDGVQVAKPQRSLMTLLDFSKAIDRVWREELLLAASSKGRPLPPWVSRLSIKSHSQGPDKRRKG